jgi:hypothetical protein
VIQTTTNDQNLQQLHDHIDAHMVCQSNLIYLVISAASI